MQDIIETPKAPAAIGSYSQAIKAGSFVFLSGQIPLNPDSMELEQGDMRQQIKRVFENIKIVAEAAGGSVNDIVRITVYLIDLSNTGLVNEEMKSFFKKFPARTTIGVSALPKEAQVEVDAIMVINDKR